MLYRENKKTGDKIFALGFGLMRLPERDGQIDDQKSKEMIDYCLENGVNYFDTAYPYHGGQSEPFLGKVLEGRRKDVFIATKLPPMRVHKYADIEKIFSNQLKNLRTDYIDYYLMHSLVDFKQWQRLKDYGIIKFIEEKKTAGAIRRIGFSAHMPTSEFIKILDDYDWDFAQIQYNYLDEDNQVGAAGVEYAKKKGISLIVMEPIRGGLLANPGTNITNIMDQAKEKKTPAAWALKWVMNHDAFLVVLSGMSTMDHIKENIKTADTAYPGCMTQDDLTIIEQVKQEYKSKIKVPCTRCAYCMPCPHGVRIPYIFESYNQYFMFGPEDARFWYMIRTSGVMGGEGKASACIECGACEKKCPQNIPIMEELKRAKELLETDDFLERYLAMTEANKKI